MPANLFSRSFIQIKCKLIELYKYVKNSKHYYCRFIDINSDTKEAIIYCNGPRPVTIKTSLGKAVGDHTLVVNLSPIEACYLGYYYGRLHQEEINAGKCCLTKGDINFILRCNTGRFKIISLERRKNITYLDTKTDKKYTQSPVDIAKNNNLIAEFDSSQACYIGIIAGVMTAKNSREVINLVSKQPLLTIVR